MTWVRLAPRLADGVTLLVLMLLAALIVTSWPTRADMAHGSWAVLAPARAVLLVVWGLIAGSSAAVPRVADPQGPGVRFADAVTRLAAAGLVTAPFEAVSHAATVPPVPLWWALLAAPSGGVAATGLGYAVTSWLAARKLAWAAALAVPAIVAGGIALDLATGTPVFAVWLLPSQPSWIAGAVLSGAALLSATVAVRSLLTALDGAS